jgi:hypothetical protein
MHDPSTLLAYLADSDSARLRSSARISPQRRDQWRSACDDAATELRGRAPRVVAVLTLAAEGTDRGTLADALDVLSELAPVLDAAALLAQLGEHAPDPLTAEQRAAVEDTIRALGRKRHAPVSYIRGRWRPWLLAAAADAWAGLDATRVTLEAGLDGSESASALVVALRALIAGR